MTKFARVDECKRPPEPDRLEPPEFKVTLLFPRTASQECLYLRISPSFRSVESGGMPRVALVQFASLSPSAPLPAAALDATRQHHDDRHEQQHAPSQFNLQRAHDYVKQAAKQGAELVVFPEYFVRCSSSSVSSSYLMKGAPYALVVASYS